MGSEEAETRLRTVLVALEPYLDDLVLIGGWVPYLHLTYGRASVEVPETSLTTEADILLPSELVRGTRLPIADLLGESGFRPIRDSEVAWIRAPGAGGETIEFMRAHLGPAVRRGSAGAVPDQPGLQALQLDHLGVMNAQVEHLPSPSGRRGRPQGREGCLVLEGCRRCRS